VYLTVFMSISNDRFGIFKCARSYSKYHNRTLTHDPVASGEFRLIHGVSGSVETNGIELDTSGFAQRVPHSLFFVTLVTSKHFRAGVERKRILRDDPKVFLLVVVPDSVLGGWRLQTKRRKH